MVEAPAGAPDVDGMWAVTAGLPEQVAAAAETARAVGSLPSADGVTAVVCFGMGGSGIGADVLAAIAAPELPVPVIVVKDYACPALVGPSTLVFASSYSGNTEETLAATGEAIDRGARVVAITTGGALAGLAGAAGVPVVGLPDVPWPRCAFGAVSAVPLVVLERLGLLPSAGAEIDAALAQLRRRRDALVAAGSTSVAATVARQIGRTIPLIHGGGALGAAAALRWKCQINENPKSPAFASTQPELCHNEICGWGQHGDITRQILTVVALRHGYEHPQVARRFEYVAELLDEVVSAVVEVRAEGAGRLAQLLDLALIGDFVALHLSAAEGVDPGPIPVLMDLKAAMAGAE
jgi:glucose/mannose-6-phosphate isomerase